MGRLRKGENVDIKRTNINWNWCNDPNVINEAIKSRDENWEGLTSAEQIISISYDARHENYVVFWRIVKD